MENNTVLHEHSESGIHPNKKDSKDKKVTQRNESATALEWDYSQNENAATKGPVARLGKASSHLPPRYVVETRHLMIHHEPDMLQPHPSCALQTFHVRGKEQPVSQQTQSGHEVEIGMKTNS